MGYCFWYFRWYSLISHKVIQPPPYSGDIRLFSNWEAKTGLKGEGKIKERDIVGLNSFINIYNKINKLTFTEKKIYLLFDQY